MIKTVPALENTAAYKAPEVPQNYRLKLDFNEGRCDASAIARYLQEFDAQSLQLYPDKSMLEAKIAQTYKVSPAQVLVTNGGDDALDRACRISLCAGREIILPSPTFEMIAQYSQLVGAKVVRPIWKEKFPLEEISSRISAKTGAIALVSPNNPTGQTIPAEYIKELSARAPQALLICDNAYAEFADTDLTSTVLSLPNTIMVRTFSKAWGLAGLRVGYVIGQEDTVTLLRAAGGPFPVSRLSLYLAQRRWEDGFGAIEPFIKEVKREREELQKLLCELGAKALPSQANFIFCEFKDSAAVTKSLNARGIIVRNFGANPYTNGAIRLSLPGVPSDFDYLKESLRFAVTTC